MSSSDLIIEIKALSKTYKSFATPLARFKQLFWGVRRCYYKTYTALKSVDLEIGKGEVVGIVGKNGAGKSTLLQLICGTLSPTSGSIRITGKISALLELGAGFNPEFTGRENIHLAAALMGLAKQDVVALEHEIIDFAGIESFIDQPVKTYSSGMFVRLAFAVATSVNPDILVIDEALSVGDGEFAKKSFDRIMALRDQGKTILFCSHSLYQIEQICNRVIWIDKGEVKAQGNPANVLKEYQGYLDSLNQSEAHSAGGAVNSELQTNEARFVSVNITNASSENAELIFESQVDDLIINVTFKASEQVVPPGVAIVINDENGQLVTSVGSWVDGIQPNKLGAGSYQLTLRFPNLPLLKGLYKISVMLFCDRGLFVYDEINEAAYIRVVQKGSELGLVSLPRVWNDALDALESSKPSVLPEQDNEILIRYANENDELLLLSLFKRCFDVTISKSLWRWKYSSSIHRCVVAQQGANLVGFFGVMPRDSKIFGASSKTAQICDVMLDPKLDNGLAKAKLFKRIKEHFTQNYVGERYEFPFAFGFPTERAQELGEKLKTYTRIDSLARLEWNTCLMNRRALGCRTFDRSDFAYLDRVWNKTHPDLKDLAVNVKDAEWLAHRYLDRPDSEYDCLLFYTRFSGEPIGVAVTRLSDDGSVELMDLIAPKAYLDEVLSHLMHVKMHQGVSLVFAIVSGSVSNTLQASGCTSQRLPLSIPGDELKDNSDPLVLKGKWWLWGGDTDSR
ncbi:MULTISPECIES: GNAT family N-acetyltransferase [unclassified Marinobacterium]|uniref:GNAT family N-acetyltransferase n=1 Tax=unclassified Marinobacterium TaxID=2644139 RepID=UPI00156A5697|nr:MULTISPECIES: GNAT family N-acetyltransferase [unclassified Marinobacterium]NRP46004.1 Teichoic acids export ATP-binding protein TagH [Marinobacterium sp. xm-d-543]NRQ22344.1 Teichoic acids export ATP-binding protein TagH [Marinobacterium sp. xm-m-312]